MAGPDDKKRQKHWREAIGVIRPARPARPAAPAAPAPPPTRTATVEDDGVSTGPVTAPEPQPKSPAASASHKREAVGISSSAVSAGSAGGGTTGDPVLRLLGELPLGSVSFADAVSRTFWKNPSAADLKALAAIAGERHLIEDEPVREAVVAAVGVRYRIERLSVGLARPILDPTVIQARAIEWGRLARRIESLVPRLSSDPRSPGAAVVEAAQSLLPEARDLEAEARLANELAGVIEAATSGETESLEMIAIGISDLPHLIEAVARRSMRPYDGLALEAVAAGLAVESAVESGKIDDLRLVRVLVRRLLVRFDQAVYELTHARDRDLERKGRVALWLRYVRTLRSQIDEALTRPARRAQLDTGPTGRTGDAAAEEERAVDRLRAARETARQTTGALGEETGSTGEPLAEPDGPVEGHDDAVPETLEEAREAAEEIERQLEHTPVTRPRRSHGAERGTDRWSMLAAAAVVVAIGLQALRMMVLPAPPPDVPKIAPADFERAVALLAVEPVGRMLVGVVDPTWRTLADDDRELALTRLMTAADARGLRAGFLTDPDGMPVARWAPGGPVEIVEPPGAP